MNKTFFVFLIFALLLPLSAKSQRVSYNDSWSQQVVKLTSHNQENAKLSYSINEFYFEEIEIDNEVLTNITLPGVFLPNEEGMPNLPGISRYIAIPNNAQAEVRITNYRTQIYQDIDIAPAPRIPLGTEDGPLVYRKALSVYNQNRNYPENIVQVSEPQELRGVRVIMLGITPFQYNPVSRELIIYRDIEIEINLSGSSGRYGDERLRSRWWDPILNQIILNYEVLPEIDYSSKSGTRSGAEYLIICPNDADFLVWADSIRIFRQQEGISTMVVTTDDIGGNTVSAIETYVDNAYNNWDTPPDAVLLLGDYGTSGNTIISHLYSHPGGYPNFASDNRFADVTGNDLPDIVFARITANNASQLETMITKFLDYERNPPIDQNFYDKPITALGWQDDRWFQICSEIVGGYFKNTQGKNPVRINALGSPASNYTSGPWSTATNTSTILNYFGPSGLGYIPSTPQELGGFTGGTATDVINAINSGSFLLQHRDHGSYTGWGEPSFQSSNINSLTNTGNKLPFIFSINCQTGAFHRSSECFTEKFHRYTYNGQNSGALGLLAATEVSYSFVNDTYIWGVMDNMYPDFMPAESTTFPVSFVMPAFGNAAGKLFLYQSSWPYNTGSKQITYRLFHHHGDAFLKLYSEVPQNLTVNHPDFITDFETSITVTADDGSFIGLSVNGEIIGTAEGSGSPVVISIPAQNVGDIIRITVTKQNYFRYGANVDVNDCYPDITTNPTSVSQALGLNATDTQSFTISNNGEAGSVLNYDILLTTGSESTRSDGRNNFRYNNSGILSSNRCVSKVSPIATDDITLKYHDGYDNNGIGTGSSASWICAARFTSDELAIYYDSYNIKQVNLCFHAITVSNVFLKIWEGGYYGNPGTEIYSQDITSQVTSIGWVTHTLSSSVSLISGNEYWVGYSFDVTSGHPSAVDAGPMISGKGAWMFWSGSWQELTDISVSLNYNWCIEMVLEEASADLTITSPNGGEIWEAGRSEDITWTHSGAALADVKLEYSIDTGSSYSTISSSTANDSTFAWSIPEGINSENCLIKISDPFDASVFDVSNAVFRIYDGVDWLSIDQSTGSINNGSSDNLILTFDSDDLSPGTYNAEIEITSNDPDEAIVIVPVSLTVNNNSSSGSGSNSGNPGGPIIIFLPTTNIGGTAVDPAISVDPPGIEVLEIQITVTDQIQSGVTVPNPEAVKISYDVDITGEINGLTVNFDLSYDGLSGLNNIFWLNGSVWQVPENVNWNNPSEGHVTFSITFPNGRENRDASTEFILSEDNPLPVSLSSLTAAFVNSHALLSWTTQSETQNVGWNVYRAEAVNPDLRLQINADLIEGAGTSSEPTNYEYPDPDRLTADNTYFYWLESLAAWGETNEYGPIVLTIPYNENNLPEAPKQTTLYGNYPNPFNPSTAISFYIIDNQKAELSIYNMKGQLLLKQSFTAGSHHFNWAANNYGTGIYYYKLKSKNYEETKKMLLIK